MDDQADGDEPMLLRAVLKRTGGSNDRSVNPAALSVAGLSRETLYLLTTRLLSVGLLERLHGDTEVRLTTAALEALRVRRPTRSSVGTASGIP